MRDVGTCSCAAPPHIAQLSAQLRARTKNPQTVCALSRLSPCTLKLLDCSFPGAAMLAVASERAEQDIISRHLPGRVRFWPLNDSLFGLFDGNPMRPQFNGSCDVLAIDADVPTAEARQGVVVGLTQALRLDGPHLQENQSIILTGTKCPAAGRRRAAAHEEYLVGGTCFRFRVPAAGRKACKRRDCLVREQCTQRSTCWRERWAELVASKWLTQSSCVSSKGDKVTCIASVARDSVCTHETPLLDDAAPPTPVSWSAPSEWRDRYHRVNADVFSAQALLRRRLRYLTVVECERAGICLVFKDDTMETWVGALRSSDRDGLHFRGAPELVLPAMWAPGKATHNMALLRVNNTYYMAGGRDHGCKVFSRNAPGCRPADPRERGIWIAKSTSGADGAAALNYQLGRRTPLLSAASGQAAMPSDVPLLSSTWVNATMALDGRHPGCRESRDPELLPWITRGVCEYDGRLSLVHFAGRFWLYARANLGRHGQRFVQATSSADGLSWNEPFELIDLHGYQPMQGDLYFFAAQANPVHPTSMLAVFPLAHRAGGCVCLSVSLDGRRWSRPRPLLRCQVAGERTATHPAAGLVRRGGSVLFYVHENVPGVWTDATSPWPHQQAAQRAEASGLVPPPRIVQYRMQASSLLRWTLDGLAELE